MNDCIGLLGEHAIAFNPLFATSSEILFISFDTKFSWLGKKANVANDVINIRIKIKSNNLVIL